MYAKFSSAQVSKLGFGCLGLSGVYNAPLPEADGIHILKEAFAKGVTFWDTSDMYGLEHANEYLLGKALKELPRGSIQLATKFGVYRSETTPYAVKGTPDYARACCEASLKRLQVDYIDLYYIHRIDVTVPIEETMGELKKLFEEGKIKYIGLSEASPDTIRRAHVVHPITALQVEYSLWTRDIEAELLPLCRELGIGIVSYSPVGRGLFGGKGVVESIPQNSLLERHPRFTGSNLEKNKAFYFNLTKLAEKHGCSTAQLAIAWILHQGEDIVPIPGTTKLRYLHDNAASLKIKLAEEDLEELTNAIPINEVAGKRLEDSRFHYSFYYANTPPPRK
ncbi:OLC1v1031730C1 [Oldenlandia corymbosa var. corymbosa]|uniref:OLC1v1031730C1 n=1 Tax=Oldenlandia corymbosa var. corymbosa TaxID=529605 RepID=A0AAV1CKT9_OLDCO|nr:OLC1v1031730C1 [Oldenlandia corymbosa var. corymbosa]